AYRFISQSVLAARLVAHFDAELLVINFDAVVVKLLLRLSGRLLRITTRPAVALAVRRLWLSFYAE
ncbi:hypothetical protein ACQWFR_24935, partial [Salmonella enterica subsp. enterica serovar Infantis]